MHTLHLHLYGPPGVGKSVLAAAVFVALRIRGVSADLVQERAKELLWENKLDPRRQSLTTSEQIAREELLEGNVSVVVTDSPPLLGVVYAPDAQKEPLRACVMDITKHWDIGSYFLARDFGEGYENSGRQQDRAESEAKALEIQGTLRQSRVPFNTVNLVGGVTRVYDYADRIAASAQARLKKASAAPARVPLRQILIPPMDLNGPK